MRRFEGEERGGGMMMWGGGWSLDEPRVGQVSMSPGGKYGG